MALKASGFGGTSKLHDLTAGGGVLCDLCGDEVGAAWAWTGLGTAVAQLALQPLVCLAACLQLPRRCPHRASLLLR